MMIVYLQGKIKFATFEYIFLALMNFDVLFFALYICVLTNSRGCSNGSRGGVTSMEESVKVIDKGRYLIENFKPFMTVMHN